MKSRAVRRALLRSEIKERIQEGRIQTRLFMPRKYEGKIDYDFSCWGRMLVNDRMKDPGDRKGGKLFRRRFRVPWPLFEQLVTITRESGWFSEKPNCTGIRGAPLELKILAVLRVLGRGYCFDGVEELCLISAESLRIFFRKFVTLFARENYAKYCTHPQTPEEIERAMGVFTKLGLPGCIGSTDCVHIRWERCPAGSRSSHKGKEGFPTLSYEVTVDHTKKIIAVTEGHPGARNDKTIVKFDGFVTKIHNGELYADVPFDLVDKEGKVTREKGLYLIVDGGYHKWKCLQCPFKHTSKSAEALWSRWVESVRKDVECTFGILKGRFRCLKLPIYYQDKDVIDSMFFTCCILHNILLHIDGYDVRWEKGVNWQGQDGHHEVDDMPSIFKRHRMRVAQTTTDFSIIGIDAVANNYRIVHGEVEEEIEATHAGLKMKLIEHFCYKFKRNEIKWLK
jgi:hypothetical protein